MDTKTVSLIKFNKAEAHKLDVFTLENLPELDNPDFLYWINIEGDKEQGIISALYNKFGVPDYLRENILVINTQRPAVKVVDEFLLFNLKMIGKKVSRRAVDPEKLILLAGNNFIITLQEGKQGDVFEKVRERLLTGRSKSRQMRVDYLCYELLDAIIESYYQTLDDIGDEIDKFEQTIFSLKENKKMSAVLHGIRNNLLTVRKAVYPLRDVIYDIERLENTLFQKDMDMYLHDLYNRGMQELETIDLYRELLASLQDLYLSNLSQRLNEIMKVLTIITTIFIPLSFITGFYGMNIDIPELHYPFLYPILVVAMLLISAGMLYWFRKKKWM